MHINGRTWNKLIEWTQPQLTHDLIYYCSYHRVRFTGKVRVSGERSFDFCHWLNKTNLNRIWVALVPYLYEINNGWRWFSNSKTPELTEPSISCLPSLGSLGLVNLWFSLALDMKCVNAKLHVLIIINCVYYYKYTKVCRY